MKIPDKNPAPSSRKKGTISLMISNYASLALVMIRGFILIPLYLRYIDEKLYGAWLATGSIVAYLGLLDFGLNGVLMQKVGANYGKKDFDNLGAILGTGLIIGFSLSSLPLILALFIKPWITLIVKIDAAQAGQLKLAFLFAGIGTSLMIAMYCAGVVVVAFQRQIVHGTVLVIGDILGVIVTFVLLFKGFGVVSIPVGIIVWALFSFVGDGIYLWWFIKNKLPPMRIRFNKEEFKTLFHQSVWQFGARSTATIASQSDNLIVAALIGPGACVILSLTKKASDMLSLLVRHFAGAFMPGLSHLHGENDKEKFKAITLLLFKITSLAGSCFMGCYLFFNRNFVGLWVGPEFFGGLIMTVFFALYGFFMVLSTTFYNVVFAQGEVISTAKANTAEAFIRVPVCILLIWFLGIKGAALAAVIAIIPTSFRMQGKSFIKTLELSKKEVSSLFKIMGMQLTIVLITGILFNRFSEPAGVFGLIYTGTAYLITVLSISILADEELKTGFIDYAKKLLNYKRSLNYG